jgi:hypothetical protein
VANRWEVIVANKSRDRITSRMKTTEGWVVRMEDFTLKTCALTFVPDRHHDWEMEDEE